MWSWLLPNVLNSQMDRTISRAEIYRMSEAAQYLFHTLNVSSKKVNASSNLPQHCPRTCTVHPPHSALTASISSSSSSTVETVTVLNLPATVVRLLSITYRTWNKVRLEESVHPSVIWLAWYSGMYHPIHTVYILQKYGASNFQYPCMLVELLPPIPPLGITLHASSDFLLCC